MDTSLAQIAQPFHFDSLEQMVVVNHAIIERVSFPLTATKKQHERLHAKLLAEPAIDALRTFHDPEDD